MKFIAALRPASLRSAPQRSATQRTGQIYMTRKPFELSVESRMLMQRMQTMEIDEAIPYAELAALIGHHVDGSSAPLRTARHRLLCDFDMVIAAERGKGVIRLSDRGIVDEAVTRSEHLRKHARRTVFRASKIGDFSALPGEYQKRHSAIVSVNATVAFMSSTRQIAKLEAAVPEGRKELPVPETLKMFLK